MSSSSSPALTCRLCGQSHLPVALNAAETARCLRCNTRIAETSRFGGRSASRAFAWAGLAFAAPATVMPFITVEKFGNVRSGDFMTGVASLHAYGMPLVGAWVLLCGALVPVALLGALALGRSHGFLLKMEDMLAHWAMPEVYVLAVLVALTRLGTLVDVELNAGFWSYLAMSFFLLIASRAQRHRPAAPAPTS